MCVIVHVCLGREEFRLELNGWMTCGLYNLLVLLSWWNDDNTRLYALNEVERNSVSHISNQYSQQSRLALNPLSYEGSTGDNFETSFPVSWQNLKTPTWPQHLVSGNSCGGGTKDSWLHWPGLRTLGHKYYHQFTFRRSNSSISLLPTS